MGPAGARLGCLAAKSALTYLEARVSAMGHRRKRRVIDEALDSHPAVLAWLEVAPQGAVPRQIEVFSDSAAWLLYALVGAGPGGSTVFAKRRLAWKAAAERTVYEQLLPRLALPTPRCHGCVSEGEYVWLLLAAVPGGPYDETNPKHLAMGGRWIAALHTRSASIAHSVPLPDAGPDRYLAHLVSGRRALEQCLRESGALDAAGRLIIERTIARQNQIEHAWPALRARCIDAPPTLVHGDFRPKNVFIDEDETELVAFDWETAGWGPPDADLTRIDVEAYWHAVHDIWPTVTLDTVRGWARMGHLFQMLAAIDWKSTELKCDTAEALATPLVSLALLSDRLDAIAPQA